MDTLLEILKLAQTPVGAAIVGLLVGVWLWQRDKRNTKKYYARINDLEKKFLTLEAVLFGIAFYQRNITARTITMATPPLAAILSVTVGDIVGRPLASVFPSEFCQVLADMDRRLSYKDEVVENNVHLMGAYYTIAKRKIFSGSEYQLAAFIHRQDTYVTGKKD